MKTDSCLQFCLNHIKKDNPFVFVDGGVVGDSEEIGKAYWADGYYCVRAG